MFMLNNLCQNRCFSPAKRNYWKSVAVIRKKNYNTVPVIDNTRGDAAIADLFKDKYVTLYNSVSSSSNSMKALHERIVVKLPVNAIHI